MELHRHHVALGLEIQGRDVGDVDGAGLGFVGVGTAPGVLALDIAAHISGAFVLGLVAHLGDLHAVDVDEGGVVVLEGTGDGLHRVGIGHIEGGAEVVGRDVLEAAGTVLGEEHLGRVSAAQIGNFTQLGAEGTLTRLPGLLGDRGARLPAVRRLSVVVAVLPLRGAGHHDVRVLGVGLGGCGTHERAAQHHGQREEERYRARSQTAREKTATPPNESFFGIPQACVSRFVLPLRCARTCTPGAFKEILGRPRQAPASVVSALAQSFVRDARAALVRCLAPNGSGTAGQPLCSRLSRGVADSLWAMTRALQKRSEGRIDCERLGPAPACRPPPRPHHGRRRKNAPGRTGRA